MWLYVSNPFLFFISTIVLGSAHKFFNTLKDNITSYTSYEFAFFNSAANILYFCILNVWQLIQYLKFYCPYS